MRTPGSLVFAALAVIALLSSACSRGDTLGDAEAIEILVLDGVERSKAECIIGSLDGEIELRRVTGVSTDITDSEIALLAGANAACTSDIDAGGGVVSGTGIPEELEGVDLESAIDTRIDDLVVGGLDAAVAECLRSAVKASPNPTAAIADIEFLSEATVICKRTTNVGP